MLPAQGPSSKSFKWQSAFESKTRSGLAWSHLFFRETAIRYSVFGKMLG
jgi:hypothetical protein